MVELLALVRSEDGRSLLVSSGFEAVDLLPPDRICERQISLSEVRENLCVFNYCLSIH